MRLSCCIVPVAVATLSAQSPVSGPVEWPVYGGGPESMRYSAAIRVGLGLAS